METARQFSVIPASIEEAVFVCTLYTQNIEMLHGENISLDEWKEILSMNDHDEENYLIYGGNTPLAWLRINGLNNKDKAWISMLVVSNKSQRQGVGTYAVKFAEEYVKSKGFVKICIRTTEDNFAANSLYKKCGYSVAKYGDYSTGDGIVRKGCTFEKILI